jgi:hypothetical protein
MVAARRSKKLSVFRSSLATLVVAASAFMWSTLAQCQGLAEDAALVAAERALLEGLSAKGPGAFEQELKGAPAQPAELQPATYKPPVIKQEPIQAEPQKQATEGVLPLPQHDEAKRVVPPTTEGTHERVAQPAVPQVAPQPNTALKRELEGSQRRVAQLERQLEEVRGQLTMAETELSRLATISEARNRASLVRPSSTTPRSSGAEAAPIVAKARFDAPHIEPTPASSADLTIATVDVEKAELRLGPGKNHSSLMTVAKGSRLAVEARQGEWLRVFAPNGQRAWIQSQLVTFGSKGGARTASSAARVHGYSSSLEDEAFQRVQSLTARR